MRKVPPGTGPREIELVTWAEETVRKESAVASDGLWQLVTLDTALLAGCAALIDKFGIPFALKLAGVALLLVSLAAALVGSLPRR